MMPAGGLLVAGAVLVTVAIVFVWRRRSAASIASLLAVLAGAVWWSVCSALELSAGDLAGREYWGDLKYVGVVLLPPAYLAFVLQCSGHTRWPRWLGPALALEPLAVLLLLAGAATHDLVRYYPPGATLATAQAAEAGPLFWPHLLYNNAIIWTGTILLIVTLSRMSRLYRGQSLLLVGAILLPIMLNLLFNLRVEPFRQVDLTPFAFVLSTAVLVWGVYQLSLLDLRPVARSQIFRTISDPVLVLDPDGRVLDANPAAGRLAGLPLPEVVGQPVGQLLPTWKETVAAAMAAGTEQATPRPRRSPGTAASTTWPSRPCPSASASPAATWWWPGTSPSGARSRRSCAPPSTPSWWPPTAWPWPSTASGPRPSTCAPSTSSRAASSRPSPTTCAPRWPRCSASP